MVLVLKSWRDHGEQQPGISSVPAEGPGLLQRSWGMTPWRQPRKGHWWQHSPLATEHSGLWGHQDHGMTTKDSSGHDVGPAEFRMQTSCTMDGHLSSFQEPRRSLVDPRHWTLSDLQSLVLICSYCDCIPVLLSWSKKVLIFYFTGPYSWETLNF